MPEPPTVTGILFSSGALRERSIWDSTDVSADLSSEALGEGGSLGEGGGHPSLKASSLGHRIDQLALNAAGFEHLLAPANGLRGEVANLPDAYGPKPLYFIKVG